MKGVILAGGTGSRLKDLVRVTNKHLLPVGEYPMIFYPIFKLLEAGIRDILVITGTEHMGAIVGCLGSGHYFNCEFTYRVQEKAGGIAQALGLARHFVGNDRMCVVLADNIFQDSIKPLAESFINNEEQARICLTDAVDPTRFGVAFLKEGSVHKLIEKPTTEDIAQAALEKLSYFAIMGIYFYSPGVFSVIDSLKPSWRQELEITDVNLVYLNRSKLKASVLSGWWTDAGTFDSLAAANHYVRGNNICRPMAGE